jgi:hypothetical protein
LKDKAKENRYESQVSERQQPRFENGARPL